MRLRIDSTAPWLTLGTAAFLLLASNRPFWSELLRAVPADSPANVALVGSTFLILLALLNLILLLFAFRWLLKPVAIALLLVAAVCAHFMSVFGVVIDRELVQSAAQTDVLEVRDLLSPRFFIDVVALGILPAVLVARAPLRFARPGREALLRLGIAGGSLALCLALVFAQFRHFVLVGREHSELRQMVNPLGPIQAMLRWVDASRPEPTLARIGEDARRPVPPPGRSRRTLLVLVVGETARAANFSLNGYARETNPLLSREPVISFTRVSSCGTATATSLPCMFSPGGREAYDESMLDSQEGLLDVLQRAGVSVLWRDNNSGCKGTCDRVENQSRRDLAASGRCPGGECFDEVLLDDLQPFIDGLRGDALIVLHQQGSHGPAYYKRSPEADKKYLPECVVSDLPSCSREALVNGYDNSILYTDLVLDRLIDLLRANAERFATGMLYVSDHGESLGENGIYLHGLPRFLAPEEQTHIPMILWLSDALKSDLGIDGACLERERDAPRSHDDLFHSLLGLFDVSTAIYRPERDLFADCRNRSEANVRFEPHAADAFSKRE